MNDRFVDGPIVTVPRRGRGTVNNTGRPRSPTSARAWGRLDATGGVLIPADGDTVTVEGPAKIDRVTVTGQRWTLTVAPGWITKPAAPAGSLVVVPQN